MFLTRLLRRISEGWTLHRGSALSASLAFYSLLSLAPVVAATVALVTWFVGSEAAHHILTLRAESTFGSAVTRTLGETLKPVRGSPGFGLSSWFALIVFFAGASGVAGELRSSLNLVWGLPASLESWSTSLRHRTREILIVLSLLFAVLAVSLASLAVAAAGHAVMKALPAPSAMVLLGNATLSLAALLFLFLLIHKYVPDTTVSWRNAVIASLCTTTLFALGKELLAVYIRKSTAGAAFGAGQSVIALLLWAYFSAAVVFLGAEVACAVELEAPSSRPRPAGPPTCTPPP